MAKDFPLYAMERLLKKAGATRVSRGAAEELKFALLEITERIARDAIALAAHAKRLTVKKEDIKLAVR